LTGSEVIACKEVSNITFLGVDGKGELEGAGINIVKSKNIIVRNLKIHHTRALWMQSVLRIPRNLD